MMERNCNNYQSHWLPESYKSRAFVHMLEKGPFQ